MEKVVACPYKRPDALYRLICFPWAGSGASHFAHWGSLFSSSIEVSSVNLPGRDSRQGEPFAKDMAHVVNEISSVLLKGLQEKPFAFFGHSFGSYVSLAVALHLKEKYGLEPIHLFLSGAPTLNSEAFTYLKTAHGVKDEDLLANLEISGGTLFEVPQNKDRKKHLINTLKEDSRVLHTWSFEMADGNIPFSCDITCFNGSEDQQARDLEAWHDLTSGDTSFYKLPGGHFYLLEPSNEIFLVKLITRYIEHAGL
ncbi:S-acyl fatty acid synthase thioesterase, medium chain [Pezoporus flaviventris]|uniref:S-acyl fatty acid synthase thioesterase, medium chain n=1 Tax=Pezoporus flaviventris TaxID=889875 RepID=UPI002AB2D23C|nr:S-acyl fatty acid synthase thioesterase, medium chain [Pezoporus flaviventris]